MYIDGVQRLEGLDVHLWFKFNISVLSISYLTPPSCISGMFGTVVSSSHPGVALTLEPDDSVAKPPTDPSAGTYSRALSGSHIDSDDSPCPDEVKVSHTLSSVTHHTRFPVIKVSPGVFSTNPCAAEGEEHKV